MATRIQWRRDTAADWASVNPVLGEGEAGVEIGTGKFKLGDGATAWADLDYAAMTPDEVDAAVASGTYTVESVKAHGATGDGVTDDTVAIQAAIDAVEAAGGGLVWFPPGHYVVTGLFVHDDNVTLDGGGAATIECSADAYGVSVDITQDPPVTYYDMTGSPYVRGDQAITLASTADAANFTAGDFVKIRTKQMIGGSTAQPIAELNQVAAVDAATGVISLVWPLVKDYEDDGVNPFAVAPMQVVQNLTIRRLHFDATGRRALALANVVGLLVDDCTFTGRSAIHAQGRFITVQNNRGHLTPDWSLPLWRPYYFAVDTGTSDVIHHANRWSSDGVGIVHIHEGIANFHSTDNVYLQPPSDPAATEQWPVISIWAASWNVRIEGDTIVNSPNSRAIDSTPSNEYPDMGNVDLQLIGVTVLGTVTDRSVYIGTNCSGIVNGCVLSATATEYALSCHSADVSIDGNILTGGPVDIATAHVGRNIGTAADLTDQTLDWAAVQTHAANVRLGNTVRLVGRNPADTRDIHLARVDSGGRPHYGDGSVDGAYIDTGTLGLILNVDGLERYKFHPNTMVLDDIDIAIGGANGTKFGLSETQKIGFYGATPVVRPTGVAVDVASIHAALVALGLIAGP